VAGVLMTAPIGVFLKGFAERASTNLLWLGGDLWITALLLLSSKLMTGEGREIRIRDGFLVGLIQGFAVMPGISRSGSTMWAGFICGLARAEAFRFSFLLSVPTIIGAVFFEAKGIGGGVEFLRSLPDGWIQGAFVAFLSGLVSLVLLKKLLVNDKWWLFSVYCMLMGSLSVIIYFLGW
jgi:undecaprenyl-diphosphatase